MIMDFGEHILQWYRVHGRELPWRGTRDPYRIWLSEVILQQGGQPVYDYVIILS